jgi:excisionase family DNA binding protein
MNDQIIVAKSDELQQLISDAVQKAVEGLTVKGGGSNKKEVFTNRQAMDYLNVSRSTLQRWRNDGLLPFRQVSGKILYKREDLENLLKEAAK